MPSCQEIGPGGRGDGEGVETQQEENETVSRIASLHCCHTPYSVCMYVRRPERGQLIIVVWKHGVHERVEMC